jgi:hypothetical protein
MLAGMRDQWIRRRTQLTNAIRGYAAEFGVIAAKGVNKIEALLTRIAEDETLPKLAKELFAQYRQDYARLQVAIEKIEAKLMAWHKHNELSRRLVKIPSIGPIGASLLVMKVTDPACFPIRSRFFGMDRSDPEGPLHRRKDPARRDHARRRRGVAQRAGGRRDCGDPAGPTRKRRFTLAGRAPQAQGSRRGAGQQDRAYCVEADDHRWALRSHARIRAGRGERGALRYASWGSAQAPLAHRRRNAPAGHDEGITSSTGDKHLPLRPELARDEQMVRSIDPKRETLRGIQWHSKPNRCLELARGNHLGQRSCATAPKGRTYDRKRSDQPLLRLLQAGGRPHMDSRVRRNERGFLHRLVGGNERGYLRRLLGRHLVEDGQVSRNNRPGRAMAGEDRDLGAEG